MQYTLWVQETHELWRIEGNRLPIKPRDYSDLIYVSTDRWDERCPPSIQFSPEAVFMKKKKGVNTSQVVVIHGFDKHGNETRQWFVRVRFGMLPTEYEREHAGAMIWPVSSTVMKASQDRWRNDLKFADSSLLTTNVPTENVMCMEKMSDLGYATRCTEVPHNLQTILALTADWGMQHHPSIKPMLDGELRRQEAEKLEDDLWERAWRADKEGGRRYHWLTEPPKGRLARHAGNAPRRPWRKTLGLPRDLLFEDALNTDMANHLWATLACGELREGQCPVTCTGFRQHVRVTHCGFSYSLLALRLVCKASNQAVDSIMERVMWNVYSMYKQASSSKSLQHFGELAAACYQTGICLLSLKAEIDVHVPELESAWLLARMVGARAATQPERVEVPTSTMRPALRHMYMRLACSMPPGERCPPLSRVVLPPGAPVYAPSDAAPLVAPKRPLGTKLLRLRCSVAEGTQGLLFDAWRVVVVSPAEARAGSIAAKEWLKRDAEWVPTVRLKLKVGHVTDRLLRARV